MPPTCDPVPYEFVVVSFIFGVKEEGGRRGDVGDEGDGGADVVRTVTRDSGV
jgi:hypothetical protein